jgi:polyisoprenoid-binding protein YceI
VNTGDEKRDAHLRSADFLDVERHPEITFVSTKVRPAEDGRLAVTGDLTIRGTTRSVDVTVEPNGVVQGPKGRVAGFTATATIDRTAFGLVWNMPVPGGVLVSEKLKVEFDVQAVAAAAALAAAA